jgi:hypothetical protein
MNIYVFSSIAARTRALRTKANSVQAAIRPSGSLIHGLL